MTMEKISLKAARINAGMTLEDAAELTGWSKNVINRWENGKVVPNVVKAEKLCEVYNIPMSAIRWA